MRMQWLLYLGLGLFIGLFFSISQVRSQSAEKPLKIGVFDLRLLMDKCELRKDKEIEINKMKDTEAAKLKEERKELDGLKSELDLMAKDNPQLAQKSKEYARKQEALALKSRWAEADVLENWEKTFQEVYSEVLRQIEEFRAKNGYDLILRYDSQPLSGSGGRVIDQLDRKIVIARAPSIDVTDALVDFINKAYEQQKKK